MTACGDVKRSPSAAVALNVGCEPEQLPMILSKAVEVRLHR